MFTGGSVWPGELKRRGEARALLRLGLVVYAVDQPACLTAGARDAGGDDMLLRGRGAAALHHDLLLHGELDLRSARSVNVEPLVFRWSHRAFERSILLEGVRESLFRDE